MSRQQNPYAPAGFSPIETIGSSPVDSGFRTCYDYFGSHPVARAAPMLCPQIRKRVQGRFRGWVDAIGAIVAMAPALPSEPVTGGPPAAL